MRYFICLIIGAALAYAFIHYYDNTLSDNQEPQVLHSGLAHYGKETLSSLKSNGLVTLEGTTIRGVLDVNGKLEAQEATIGSLDVNGAVNLTNCQVKGKSKINGFVNATKTTFYDEFNAASQKIVLNDCTASSIVVRNIPWIPGSQVIELNKKSKVEGNITFESGTGKVILSEGSVVSGTVTGGEIEKK